MHVFFAHNILVTVDGWPPAGHFTLVTKFKTAKVYIYKEHKKCLGNLVGLLYCLVFRFPGTLKFVALLIISHLLRDDVMQLFDGKDNKIHQLGGCNEII